MKIINQTQNGKVFRCDNCKAIHVEFNNLNLNFSSKQLNRFVKAINSIDGENYERVNQKSQFERKIVIPTQQRNLNILLTNQELLELKLLLREGKTFDDCFMLETDNAIFSYYKN